MIFAGGTSVVRTGLPGLENLLRGSTFLGRSEQASEAQLELPFGMATMIREPEERMVASGTILEDKVISAEIELADITPQPLTPQPDVPAFHTNTFEHYIANLMLPLYRDGIRSVGFRNGPRRIK